MLYPVDNEIRQVKSLDGIWRFKKENRMEEGFEEKWYEKPAYPFDPFSFHEACLSM